MYGAAICRESFAHSGRSNVITEEVEHTMTNEPSPDRKTCRPDGVNPGFRTSSRREWLRGLAGASLVGLLGLGGGSLAGAQKELPSKPLYPVDCCQIGDTLYVCDIHAHSVWKWGGSKYTVFYGGSPRYRTPLYRPWDIAPWKNEGVVVSDPGTMDIWLLRFDGTVKPFSARLTRPDEDRELEIREQRFAGVLDKPMALAVSDAGSVFVADLGLHAVYEFSGPGESPRELARVRAPRGLAIDKDGSLLVVSHGEHALVRIKADGSVTPVVKGTLVPIDRPSFPHQVVLFGEDGYLISDGYARTLWYVTPAGEVSPAYQGEPLLNPVGLWKNSDGSVLVADPHRRQIFRFTPDRKLEPFA